MTIGGSPPPSGGESPKTPRTRFIRKLVRSAEDNFETSQEASESVKRLYEAGRESHEATQDALNVNDVNGILAYLFSGDWKRYINSIKERPVDEDNPLFRMVGHGLYFGDVVLTQRDFTDMYTAHSKEDFIEKLERIFPEQKGDQFRSSSTKFINKIVQNIKMITLENHKFRIPKALLEVIADPDIYEVSQAQQFILQQDAYVANQILQIMEGLGLISKDKKARVFDFFSGTAGVAEAAHGHPSISDVKSIDFDGFAFAIRCNQSVPLKAGISEKKLIHADINDLTSLRDNKRKFSVFTMLAPPTDLNQDHIDNILFALSDDAVGVIGVTIPVHHMKIVDPDVFEDEFKTLELLKEDFHTRYISFEEAHEKGLCKKGRLIADAYGGIIILRRKESGDSLEQIWQEKFNL
ncbi:MAG: hypothetical protein AAF621_00275 [Pseudomonadota bacterium]